MSHAAPTRHFASKAALLSAIALDGGERMIASVRAAVAQVTDSQCGRRARRPAQPVPAPTLRLRAFTEAYVRWIMENRPHHRAMRHPDVLRHAQTELVVLLQGFRATIEELIAEAQAHGWRTDVEHASLTLHFITTLHGIASVLTEPIIPLVIGAVPSAERLTYTVDTLFADDKHAVRRPAH